jgi:hypothetical protein
VKPWVLYSAIRVGIFAASFALLYWALGVTWWLAAVLAAVIGLCVAYLFFRPQRDEVVNALVTRATQGADEAAEDER